MFGKDDTVTGVPTQDTAREPLIRNISDTALWVAVYRARETERRDALFRDPLARRLAGQRGEKIARSMPYGERHAWSYAARTWLVDRMIAEQVGQGMDMVVNLAAGLDTRPYRMDLPASLNWIEVDLPGMIDYKEQILSAEKPVCRVERVSMDLSKVSARKGLFADLGRRARKALVVSEGLVVYLSSDEVAALAQDLASPPAFQGWILDLVSPGLLKMINKNLGRSLRAAGSPLKFGPEEGPGFFRPYGWHPAEVHPLLQTAAKLKRLSFGMRLVALLPGSNDRQGSRPWGGVCRLVRE